jgi:cbb3-type cytochrome oxidase maturation protein|nr:cbb3-type cytochrome oxidase assembly protein CcoS [uncultured Pseudoxanthomonas sp.]
MNILLMLLPISLVLLGLAIAAFAWAVRKGQFDDLDTPALDILDDAPPRPSTPSAPALREGDDGA